MDLQQYVADATRTESRIEKVKVNRQHLMFALYLFADAGSILDQIKKKAFYGKKYDGNELGVNANSIRYTAESLERWVAQGHHHEENEIDIDPRIFHAIIGIATEATELVEAMLKTLNGVGDDNINILEEFGDLNWYEAIGIDALDGDFEQVLTTNIEKLRARFPEKFTSENAINRNLDTERQILEKLDS